LRARGDADEMGEEGIRDLRARMISLGYVMSRHFLEEGRQNEKERGE